MSNTKTGTIRFTNGKKISFELYPDVAPLSVANFIQLAETGFYDGMCFHRVMPDFMIQGGGFLNHKGNLKEQKSKQVVKGEFSANGVKNDLAHHAGVFSMARTNVMDSATSQFFICVNDVHFLDGQYAAFGKVTDEESLNVAIAISKVKTQTIGHYADVPVQPVEIQTIEID